MAYQNMNVKVNLSYNRGTEERLHGYVNKALGL